MPLLVPLSGPHCAFATALFWLAPGPGCPLPLLAGHVEAGFPSPAADYLDDVLDLNDLLIRNPPSTFMMRAAGRSMEQAGIADGDLLVVDRSLEARHGDVVIALLDGELTVKHLHRQGGRVGLVAANDAFPAIELKEGMELVVWGVVTHLIRTVR